MKPKLPSSQKKRRSASVVSSSDESSGDEEDPNTRRALLGEFKKRYRYNIPMRQQFSDPMCNKNYPPVGVIHSKRMLKNRAKRTLTFYPLREVHVILEQNNTDGERQVDASGKTLTFRFAPTGETQQ